MNRSPLLFATLVLIAFLVPVGCAKDSQSPGSSGTGGGSGTDGGGTGGTQGSGGGSGGGTPTGGAPGSGGRGGGVGTGGIGSSTGGTTGAGGAAGGVAGTGAVSCTALPFCDDFQAGIPAQPPNVQKWTVDLNGSGTVTIDGTMGHNSTQSLHVHPNNGFHTMAMVKGAPVFPLPAGVLYGRAYVRLGGTLTNNHVVWIEAGSILNDVNETRIGANLGLLDVNLWPGDADHRATGVTLVPGSWDCVEFMFDNTARETRVWLNSTELPDLHVTNWSVPSYDAVRFGWELNAGTSDIWYDDVALGYTRIGCL